jgi:hypothetical protein
MPLAPRRATWTTVVSLTALLWMCVGSAGATATVTHLPESTSTFSFTVVNPCTGGLGLYTATTTTNATVVATAGHFMFNSRSSVDESFEALDPLSNSSDHGHGVRHSVFLQNQAGEDPFSGTTVMTSVSRDVFNVPGGGVVLLRSLFHTTITGGLVKTEVVQTDTVCNSH